MSLNGAGSQFYENLHVGGGPITVTTQEIVKKVFDLVLRDRRMTTRQIVENTGLDHRVKKTNYLQ